MRPSENIEKLIKNINIETNTKTEKAVLVDVTEAFEKSKNTKSAIIQPSIWRIIMKSNITKLATAAVIIVAALIGINQFSGRIGITSVGWADVSANIENAKSVTWKSTSIEKGNSTIYRFMFLEPCFIRIEEPDGKVVISDSEQEKTLIIDQMSKTAAVRYTQPKMFNYYKFFSDFLNMRGLSVKVIGTRQIHGKHAIGFNLEPPKGNDGYYGVMENNELIISYEIVFWVDPETKLPTLVEQSLVGAEGRIVNTVYDEILFDAELDQSLFSLEVPDGYKLQYDSNLDDRMKSAVTMNQILKVCMIYDNQHGQWPDSLQELGLPDIDVSRYIYLKPDAQPDDSTIVLYEAYERWENGINVGFGNYRVQFIEDETEFQKLLERK